MNRVLRIDERLGNLKLPTMEKVKNIQLANNDVLIICAGFEDRSTAVLENAINFSKQGFHVIIIEYDPYIEDNKVKKIKDLCSRNNINHTTLKYDRQNPTNGGHLCISHIPLNSKKLWIDISGMSRLLIVQLLVALSQREKGFKDIYILYAEAGSYPPDKEEVELALQKQNISSDSFLIFLSSGVFEVSIVPELSSVALQGLPIRLVVFPSFNSHQLIALRSVIQPSFITMINGLPPDIDNQWRTEAIRKINAIDKILNKEEALKSTLDYRDTFKYLLNLYGQYSDLERLVIAPIGSKMQSLAVGLIRSYLDDLQVVYPTPRSFTQPSAYTIGVKQLYCLQLSGFHSKNELSP